jgi:hypothetical protein
MNDKHDYDLIGYVSDLADVHMYGVLPVSRIESGLASLSGRNEKEKRDKKKKSTLGIEGGLDTYVCSLGLFSFLLYF